MKNLALIILNYYAADKTEKCLQSLLYQDIKTVLIVDNSGNSLENKKTDLMVKRIESSGCNFKIYSLYNKNNLGFAKGVNEAVQWLEANHPHFFYCILNNDAVINEGSLDILIERLEHENDLYVISPQIITEKDHIQSCWYNVLFGIITSKKTPFSYQYLSGCCLIFRRNLLLQVPQLFDEDFFMYGEDAELSWRLKNKKIRTALDNRCSILHEGVGSSRQGGLFYEYHLAVAHFLIAAKIARPMPIFYLICLLRIIVLFLRASVRSIRYKNIIPFKAFLSAIILSHKSHCQ